MDAGYCLYVHIFMKNIKSLKQFNFYNSNQLMSYCSTRHEINLHLDDHQSYEVMFTEISSTLERRLWTNMKPINACY